MDFITARRQYVKQQNQMRPGSNKKAKRPTPIVALGCVLPPVPRRKSKANQSMTQGSFALIQSLHTRSTLAEDHPFPTLTPRTLDSVLPLSALLNGR